MLVSPAAVVPACQSCTEKPVRFPLITQRLTPIRLYKALTALHKPAALAVLGAHGAFQARHRRRVTAAL
jgi:hypothetical protein